MLRDTVLLLVLLAALAGIYRPPRGIRDWQVAAAGGIAAVALSPLSAQSAVGYLADEWGIFAFFLGLMLIAAGAEAAGLYSTLANALQRRASTLAATAFVAGLGITAILSNDATPLVLTPAVLLVATRTSQAPTASAFTVTFVADGASMLLPVSNPVCLLFFERLNMDVGEYLRLYTLPALAGAVVVGLVALRRTQNRATAIQEAPAGLATPGPPAYRRFALLVILALTAGYVVSGFAGIAPGAVTLAAGVLLAAGAPKGGADLAVFRQRVAPGILVLIAGMLLAVEAAGAAGVLDSTGDLLERLAEQPPLVAIGATAIFAMALSNIMNNWPAALLLSSAILASPGQSPELVAGALIGCAIGANLTALGSLSTVFWMSQLRGRGIVVSPAAYFRQAWAPTICGVAAACATAAAQPWA